MALPSPFSVWETSFYWMYLPLLFLYELLEPMRGPWFWSPSLHRVLGDNTPPWHKSVTVGMSWAGVCQNLLPTSPDPDALPMVPTTMSEERMSFEQLSDSILENYLVVSELPTCDEKRETFRSCMQDLLDVNVLAHQLRARAGQPYQSTNADHEAMLEELWILLLPGEEREGRLTSQWARLGFQGKDPATDFRGMGMLGLDNLLYFARHHTMLARRTLSRSHDPTFGFPFAIAGINLTQMILSMTEGKSNGSLDVKEYPLTPHYLRFGPTNTTFNEIYSRLFAAFAQFYLHCEPADVMQWGAVKTKFERNLRHHLRIHNYLCL